MESRVTLVEQYCLLSIESKFLDGLLHKRFLAYD